MFENISITTVLVSYVALLFSLSVHEASHATAAYLLDDDTAARLGRMTLNPIAHVDLIGTVVFPLAGLLLGGFFIGWAKPVPFNPSRLTRRIRMKVGGALVSLAGPVSNVVLSFLVLAIMCLSIRFVAQDPSARWTLLNYSFQGPVALARLDLGAGQMLVLSLGGALVTMNVLLAAFNILPLGPLDGAGVLRGMLPDRVLPRYDYYRYHPYTMPILFLLMITGAVGFFLTPVRLFLYWALEPIARLILGA
ncbi:MAG: site-2 protease family protein [Holophaga sp.]|nr:site-2 protease family protein [Holophaga sp.]